MNTIKTLTSIAITLIALTNTSIHFATIPEEDPPSIEQIIAESFCAIDDAKTIKIWASSKEGLESGKGKIGVQQAIEWNTKRKQRLEAILDPKYPKKDPKLNNAIQQYGKAISILEGAPLGAPSTSSP